MLVEPYYFNHFKPVQDHFLCDGEHVSHVICPSDGSIKDSSPSAAEKCTYPNAVT